MTPLTLAADVSRSIAFLRDVVGYGRLPGETSALDAMADFTVAERATVLAWYWPQRGYQPATDPFAAFETARSDLGRARDPQLALRVMAGDRFGEFLISAAAAGWRSPDDVAGAICWRATCSGDRLLGVLDGTQGLSFRQFLSAVETLGLRFIDPEDDGSAASWTSVGAELRRIVVDAIEQPVRALIELARLSLLDTQLEAVRNDLSTASEIPAVWRRLSEAWESWGETDDELAVARHALTDRDRLTGRSRIGEVVAELVLGPRSADCQEAGVLLGQLLRGASPDLIQIASERLQTAARALDSVPPVAENITHGFGWLVKDPRGLGERIDEAVAELTSVSTARSTIRRLANLEDKWPPLARPGDTYEAPAPGSRYRALYEALASHEASAMLEVDPTAARIRGSQGWIDLPAASVRDRTWWSGSGQSAAGRPQVRAWWAAGFGAPDLTLNGDGLIVAVRFLSLPGRSEWLKRFPLEERVSRGVYTVPAASNTPYHAVHSYSGPSVWEMGDEEFGTLGAPFRRVSAALSPAVGRSSRSAEEAEGPTVSDERTIEGLVRYLREHGESGRREIEEHIAASASGPGAALVTAGRLPNILAKARRQKLIVNIGTRKQPRWVAAGSPAHLTARLANELGREERSGAISKVAAPVLAPGEPVPADLYRSVIRRLFPHIETGEVPAGASSRDEGGRAVLSDAGLKAVLDGRRLTSKGVELLLNRIDLAREAQWDAAATSAGLESSEMVVDEEDILTGPG